MELQQFNDKICSSSKLTKVKLIKLQQKRIKIQNEMKKVGQYLLDKLKITEIVETNNNEAQKYFFCNKQNQTIKYIAEINKEWIINKKQDYIHHVIEICKSGDKNW